MAALILILAALIAAARLQGAPVPLLFWGNPIVLEFACGCLLCLADRQGWLRGKACSSRWRRAPCFSSCSHMNPWRPSSGYGYEVFPPS
jgi:hypothetical protein